MAEPAPCGRITEDDLDHQQMLIDAVELMAEDDLERKFLRQIGIIFSLSGLTTAALGVFFLLL